MRGPALLVLAAPLLFAGCVKNLATSAVADALSGSGGVYGQDDDPELVEHAVPFALKTMEGVLVEQPEHIGLLTSLTSGFVQYGYAFVEQQAHRIEEDDYDRAVALRARAARHYRRALAYGLRGLSVQHGDVRGRLESDPEALLAELEAEEVPLVYWTAAAWGLTIASANLDPAALAELPAVEKLAARALELDPTWNDGTLYELRASLASAAPGGDLTQVAADYAKAIELSGGRRAGTFVARAENVHVSRQQAAAFREDLNTALAIDVDAHVDDRLANTIMQRRARRLLAQIEDLFLDPGSDETATSTTTESN